MQPDDLPALALLVALCALAVAVGVVTALRLPMRPVCLVRRPS